jgi:hypothetical protein
MGDMTVIDLLRDALKRHGYDGLGNADAGCACLLDELAECGEICNDCEAGHSDPVLAVANGTDFWIK